MTLPLIAANSSEEFLAQYHAGKPALLWYQVLNDTQTPFAIYAKLKQPHSYSYLLESVQGGENRGRYSIMGTDPDLLWRCRKMRAEINHAPNTANFTPCSGHPRESLQRLIDASRIEHPAELPLLSSMLVGYLGYDCVHWQETIPDSNPDPLATPDGFMMRPQVVLVCDTITDTLSVIVACYRHDINATSALRETRDKLNAVMDCLNKTIPSSLFDDEKISLDALQFPEQMDSNMSSGDFQDHVRRAQDYIRAGDIFQVVLSQRFSMLFALPPLALFRELRHSNPSPYLFFLECGDFVVTGSSPELMVRLRSDEVTIRPIAGTRPRGANTEEDHTLAEELRADPKECAEHLMLLDLGRNDVGRVSEIGSVRVTEQFTIERYSHVMHIVSNVTGRLASGQHRLDALLAGFPAGTVSGAPKIRAMEIIDELEPVRRGIYAGCVGYFDGADNMDNCIALRTAILKDGVLTIQAGAGIVADSIPESEHQECLNKSQAIFAAAKSALKRAQTSRQG